MAAIFKYPAPLSLIAGSVSIMPFLFLAHATGGSNDELWQVITAAFLAMGLGGHFLSKAASGA